MAYDDYESSVEEASPVEVYEFTAGATTFYYTSAEVDTLLGVHTYLAIEGLQRGTAEDGPDRRERDFVVDMPTSAQVAQLFLGTLPGFRVRLVVKRFHADDLPTPEVVQVFNGFVQGASFSKGEGRICTLTARPEIASVGRTMPRRTFQAACNHVLYHPTTCKVDSTSPDFRASALSVASQVGTTLTVAGGISGTYADGWFNAGFVELVGGSDFRLVLSQLGNVLELLSPFVSAPSTINAYAGCAHDGDACFTKFDNVLNYGGFLFGPPKNIFQTGIL